MTPDESDKILFDFLSDKHKETGTDFDALDTKFSQIITLNGVMLSIILLNGKTAGCPPVYYLGIFTIVISMLIGLLVYCPKDYDEGLGYFSQNAFPDNRPTNPIEYRPELDRSTDLKKFNGILMTSIIRNMNILDTKANRFQYVLVTLFFGITFVMAGYYVTFHIPTIILWGFSI